MFLSSEGPKGSTAGGGVTKCRASPGNSFEKWMQNGVF